MDRIYKFVMADGTERRIRAGFIEITPNGDLKIWDSLEFLGSSQIGGVAANAYRSFERINADGTPWPPPPTPEEIAELAKTRKAEREDVEKRRAQERENLNMAFVCFMAAIVIAFVIAAAWWLSPR